MDPLLVIASVTTIIDACFRVTQTLNQLQEKYQRASLTIFTICSETTTISLWLTQLRNFFAGDATDFITRFQTQAQLATAFDIALTGCMMLFSGLEIEIKKLGDMAGAHFGSMTWKAKLRFAWKEDNMVSLQQQLRGQAIALSFLVQGLQTYASVDFFYLIGQ